MQTKELKHLVAYLAHHINNANTIVNLQAGLMAKKSYSPHADEMADRITEQTQKVATALDKAMAAVANGTINELKFHE